MNAVILLQKCSQTKKTFANRVEERSTGSWYKNWAFPIKDSRAKKEGYDKGSINGMLYTAEEYPGCPDCGSRSSVRCSTCRRLTCWNGETEMTCQWCGAYMTGIATMTKGTDFDTNPDI